VSRSGREGCVEILTDPARADAAERETEWLAAAGIPLRFVKGAELACMARLEGARGAVLDPTAGQIDGLRLVRAMRPVLEKLGVMLFEGTPVLGIEEGATIRLSVPGARISAKALVLATNAYTPRLGYFPLRNRPSSLTPHRHRTAPPR